MADLTLSLGAGGLALATLLVVGGSVAPAPDVAEEPMVCTNLATGEHRAADHCSPRAEQATFVAP